MICSQAVRSLNGEILRGPAQLRCEQNHGSGLQWASALVEFCFWLSEAGASKSRDSGLKKFCSSNNYNHDSDEDNNDNETEQEKEPNTHSNNSR